MDSVANGLSTASSAPQRETGGSARIGEAFSIFLDHVRWISALLVVIGHIRQLFFVDYADVTHKSPLWSAFYAASRMQHQAVLLFFLMSGAVIAGRFTVWSNWRRFDLAGYAVARLTRLWLVLLPVLAVCLLQLLITPARYLPDNCTAAPGVVIGNLFFLQEIMVPALCVNVPLWSLANEFWYYTFMGLIVFATVTPKTGQRWVAMVLICGAAAMIAASDTWTEKAVLPYFPIWLLGALTLHPRLPAPPLLPAAAIFLAALVGVRVLSIGFYARDWIFALAAFLLLLAVRDVHPRQWLAHVMQRSAWLARPLAGQSYSLYLVHYPVCIAVFSTVLAWRGVARSQPDLAGLGIMAFILLASYGVAQAFYRLFEARTGAVRAAVEARLRGRIA